MKIDQSVRNLPHNRRLSRDNTTAQEPLVDPGLLSNLRNRGIALNDISIDVLSLKGCESKKLYSLGILKLDQLSNTTESALLAIPHFGVMKVRRLKAKLNSYLLTLSTGANLLPGMQTTMKNVEQPLALTHEGDPQSSSTVEFISELEAASESLVKLKRRIRLYVAEIRKNQS